MEASSSPLAPLGATINGISEGFEECLFAFQQIWIIVDAKKHPVLKSGRHRRRHTHPWRTRTIFTRATRGDCSEVNIIGKQYPSAFRIHPAQSGREVPGDSQQPRYTGDTSGFKRGGEFAATRERAGRVSGSGY